MEENFEIRVNELKAGIAELLERSNSEGKNFISLRDDLSRLILTDIRNTMNEKHGAIYDQLQKFSTLVDNVVRNANNQDNQKLLLETSRIATDVSAVYTKIASQEGILQTMYKLVGDMQNSRTEENVIKLNEEFAKFSRGFEQITFTLNKNFTEFLAQIQANSPKEDFRKLQVDLDGINNNTNAIISALAIIDHKYQDLKSLITLITEKESSFIEGMQQLTKMGNKFNEFAHMLGTLAAKEDTSHISEKITAVSVSLTNLFQQSTDFGQEQKIGLENYFSSLTNNIEVMIKNNNIDAALDDFKLLCTRFTALSEAIKDEVAEKLADFAANLSKNNEGFQNAFAGSFVTFKNNLFEALSKNNDEVKAAFTDEFEKLKSNLGAVNSEVVNLQTVIADTTETQSNQLVTYLHGLSDNVGELKNSVLSLGSERLDSIIASIKTNIHTLDESLDLRFNGNLQVLSSSIDAIKTDVQTVFAEVSTHKELFNEASKENLIVMRELIEKALSNIENLRIGTQMKHLAIMVEQNAEVIRESFETMRENFAQISESSNIEVLKQLNESIPGISDRLEIFRTLISNENTKNNEKISAKIEQFINDSKTAMTKTTEQLKTEFEFLNKDAVEKLQEGISSSIVAHKGEIEKIAKDAISIAEIAATNVQYELLEYKTAFSNLSDKLNEKIDANFDNTVKNVDEKLGDAKRSIDIKLDSAIGKVDLKLGEVKTEIDAKLTDTKYSIDEKLDAAIVDIDVRLDGVKSELDVQLNGTKQDLNTKFSEQKTITDKIISEIETVQRAIKEEFSDISTKIESLKRRHTSDDTIASESISTTLDEMHTGIEKVGEKTTQDVIAKILSSNGLTLQNIGELQNEITNLNVKATENRAVIVEKLDSVLDNSDNTAKKLDALKKDILAKFSSKTENSEDQKIETVLGGIEELKEQIRAFSDKGASTDELARVSNKTMAQKIDDLVDNFVDLQTKIKTLQTGSKKSTSSGSKDLDSGTLKEFMSGFEFLQNNFIEELKGEFKIQKDVFNKLGSQQAEAFDIKSLKKVVQETIEKNLSSVLNAGSEGKYTLYDVEADLEKLKATIEYEQRQHLPDRLDEIRNIGLENMRLNKTADSKVSGLSDWLNNTNKTIEMLAEKIEQAEKLNLQEIKTRLIKNDDSSAAETFTETVNELMAGISKKYQIQEIKIENIDEKISMLIQNQSEIVDMQAFINTFHENALQTKGLIARVEGIENQISGIQSSLEKIIKYIEE